MAPIAPKGASAGRELARQVGQPPLAALSTASHNWALAVADVLLDRSDLPSGDDAEGDDVQGDGCLGAAAPGRQGPFGGAASGMQRRRHRRAGAEKRLDGCSGRVSQITGKGGSPSPNHPSNAKRTPIHRLGLLQQWNGGRVDIHQNATDDYLEMSQKRKEEWAVLNEKQQQIDASARRRMKWLAIGVPVLVVALISGMAVAGGPSPAEEAYLVAVGASMTGNDSMTSDAKLQHGYEICEAPTEEPDRDEAAIAVTHLCPEKSTEFTAHWAAFDRVEESAAAARKAAAQAAADKAARSITIECHQMYDISQTPWQKSFVIDRESPDFTAAWSMPFPQDPICTTSTVAISGRAHITDTHSSAEQAILARTTSKISGSELPHAYEHCVEHGSTFLYKGSPQDADRMNALDLCPNHPDAASWKQSLADSEAYQAAEDAWKQKLDAGTAIGRGSYTVGSAAGQMKPGTWRTTSTSILTDCYWERSTSNGDIIENNFATAASKVTVTVRSGELFTTNGCGTWEKVA